MRRLAWLALLAGCSPTATVDQLKARAAFDLSCSEDRIAVYEIDVRTRGVRGCNQQVTYVETCQQAAWGQGPLARECTWVLNTDGRPAPSAKPPLRCGPGTVERDGLCVAAADEQ